MGSFCICSGIEFSCPNVCQVIDSVKACPMFTTPVIAVILAIIFTFSLLAAVIGCFVYHKGLKMGEVHTLANVQHEEETQLIHFE